MFQPYIEVGRDYFGDLAMNLPEYRQLGREIEKARLGFSTDRPVQITAGKPVPYARTSPRPPADYSATRHRAPDAVVGLPPDRVRRKRHLERNTKEFVFQRGTDTWPAGQSLWHPA